MKRKLRKLFKQTHSAEPPKARKSAKSEPLFIISRRPNAHAKPIAERGASLNEKRAIARLARRGALFERVEAPRDALTPTTDLWATEGGAGRRNAGAQPAVPLPLSAQSYNPSLAAHTALAARVVELAANTRTSIAGRSAARRAFFLWRDRARRRQRALGAADRAAVAAARQRGEARQAERIGELLSAQRNAERKAERRRAKATEATAALRRRFEVGLAYRAPRLSRHRLPRRLPDISAREELPGKLGHVEGSQPAALRDRFDLLFRRGRAPFTEPGKPFRTRVAVERKRGLPTEID